jgi:hypothetical protein
MAVQGERILAEFGQAGADVPGVGGSGGGGLLDEGLAVIETFLRVPLCRFARAAV